jgi:hypothetical protein
VISSPQKRRKRWVGSLLVLGRANILESLSALQHDIPDPLGLM